MDKITREIILLILQFFEEEGFKESAHMLQRESGCYFDMRHFEHMVVAGKLDDADTYLSNFPGIFDNKNSTKIFFELRKQKYLEALDRNDRAKALEILMKDLKMFTHSHQDPIKEMTQLLIKEDIREHESLAAYGDARSMRKILIKDIKKNIETNPQFAGKLHFSEIRSNRLRTLLKQSLIWKHSVFRNPRPEPIIQTLMVDHVCKPSLNLAYSASSGYHSSSTITNSTVNRAPRRDPGTSADVTVNRSEITQGSLSHQNVDEVTWALANELPNTVIHTLRDTSATTSMDFHPVSQTILLAGTDVGNIGLWEVASGKNLIYIHFEVWDEESYSAYFKASMERDVRFSVNRIIWSPDGSCFGAAFSKHIVQIYSYDGGDLVSPELEIEAHKGSVNDLAFSSLHDEHNLVISCGDDKTVKVWDAVSGEKLYTFDGHRTPVYSICPHKKESVHFIFSTSTDGNIKAWLYDTMGPRVDFEAPGFQYTKLAYSTDDKRLFSCGTGKKGDTHLVEWDETEGFIKRVYEGLKSPCFATIQFHTAKNRFLAVGNDHRIKFWDMDNVEMLTSTNANGGLLAHPCVRFNKEGSLLAVTAKENRIKILASGKNKKKEAHTKSSFQNIPQVTEPHQCKFIQLPFDPQIKKVSESRIVINSGVQIMRLSYTVEGDGILALASNGIHFLWKWPQNIPATTFGPPQLWKPRSGFELMRNDTEGLGPGESATVASFAISKNDSYLISTSGGVPTLFNMLTYKKLESLAYLTPKATALALNPRNNNVFAIGSDDSRVVILICDARAPQVRTRLEGHSKRITSLAFSATLNVLVSADMNGQIIVWNLVGWKKVKDRYLQIHAQNNQEVLFDTHIEFHVDETRFLAVQDSHLAIYEALELACLNQLVAVPPVPISQATFSCDGNAVYASFVDGTVAVFDGSSLDPVCRINLNTCIYPALSDIAHPTGIAANPNKENQFAVGLSNGSVYVFEPPQGVINWAGIPCRVVEDEDETNVDGVPV